MIFVNYAENIMESGFQVDCIYTDFSEAFDRVQHEVIIAKLSKIGIHSSLLSWITSYLTDRRYEAAFPDEYTYCQEFLNGVIWAHCYSCFSSTMWWKYSDSVTVYFLLMTWRFLQKCVADLMRYVYNWTWIDLFSGEKSIDCPQTSL